MYEAQDEAMSEFILQVRDSGKFSLGPKGGGLCTFEGEVSTFWKNKKPGSLHFAGLQEALQVSS